MRTSVIERKTLETDIHLKLNLDGGTVKSHTGIGFFDHMLNSFATHGGFGLEVKAVGDLDVDYHHTVEDVGIVLGKAFCDALGDKSGIKRFGNMFIPMDEALASAFVDISGRPFLAYNASLSQERVGDFDTCLCEEFFRSFAFNAGITLHINLEYGSNSHHEIEAIFKAVAHALKQAITMTNGEVLSTKGVL